MIEIKEYVSGAGENPFRRWFDELDPRAAAIVTIAIGRLSEGNTSNVKSISGGVAELKIDRGPGYRVYFGWDGKVLVILLGGGTNEDSRTISKPHCSVGVTTSFASPVSEGEGNGDAIDKGFS